MYNISAGIFMSKVWGSGKGTEVRCNCNCEGPGAANPQRSLWVTCCVRVCVWCPCICSPGLAYLDTPGRVRSSPGLTRKDTCLSPRSGLKWLVSICGTMHACLAYMSVCGHVHACVNARAQASSQVSAETCCLRLMKVTGILQSIPIIKALFIKNKLY